MAPQFYETCYCCRCAVPNGLVKRRTVKVGYSTNAKMGFSSRYETVSLCGVCDQWEVHRLTLERHATRRFWFSVARFFLFMFAVNFLMFSGVPPATSLASMVLLVVGWKVIRSLYSHFPSLTSRPPSSFRLPIPSRDE